MKKFFLPVFFLLLSFLSIQPAHAQFNVDWGTSNDTGNFGFTDLGAWFKDNGYAANQAAGENFAKTGYIGHGSSDSDPFFFKGGESKFEVVARNSGNASLTSFGYYLGTGAGKSLTGVLGAGVNGPQTVNTGSNFGVYMNAPASYHSPHNLNWFTDRAENLSQQTGGSSTNAGGDPQALIYKIAQDKYLVAWDDLNYSNIAPGQSDRDFNDAYLKVTVTPEPINMALFGLGAGALGLAGFRRRKIAK